MSRTGPQPVNPENAPWRTPRGGFSHTPPPLPAFTTEQDSRTVTATYTLDPLDDLILANGTFTVTMPLIANAQRKRYTVKRVGAGAVTVDGNGVNIDTAATYILSPQESLDLMHDGSQWYVV
jgi:hypothetical protein